MTKLEIVNYARYGLFALLVLAVVVEIFFDLDFFEKLFLGVIG